MTDIEFELAIAQRDEALAEVERLQTSLAKLVAYLDSITCTHEDAHRGGTIWTICDGCGAKWADDEGGFVPHVDAPEVAGARALI